MVANARYEQIDRFYFRRPLLSTTPLPYSSNSIAYSSSRPTTPIPGLHAGKSLAAHKLIPPPVPLSTIRAATEASSTAAPPPSPSSPSAPLSAQHDEPQPEHDDTVELTEDSTQTTFDDDSEHIESATQNNDADDTDTTKSFEEHIEETTTIDQQLRKISDEIDRLSQTNEASEKIKPGRHSFLSLNDLMKSLRTADKPDKRITPQIDSAYSNTMHVLGETASIVGGNGDDTRKTIDLRHTNRAL